MRTRTLLSTLAIIGALAITSSAAGRGPGGSKSPGVQPPTAELTAAEAANILYMRQEEKLARDVYLHFAEVWDCPVFANIAKAEQRHMDAVGLLITKYGLEDPAADNTAGVFSSPEFAEMYATLLEDGAGSLLEALSVGVRIETLDIADLEKVLQETDKSDLQWVFENLLAGSNSHLAAFTRNIASGGTTCIYRSACGMRNGQIASADDLASQGRGRGGKGNGGGNGQGSRQRKRDGSCLPTPSV